MHSRAHQGDLRRQPGAGDQPAQVRPEVACRRLLRRRITRTCRYVCGLWSNHHVGVLEHPAAPVLHRRQCAISHLTQQRRTGRKLRLRCAGQGKRPRVNLLTPASRALKRTASGNSAAARRQAAPSSGAGTSRYEPPRLGHHGCRLPPSRAWASRPLRHCCLVEVIFIHAIPYAARHQLPTLALMQASAVDLPHSTSVVAECSPWRP